MFERYSLRARQLIFLARYEAGRRGAQQIDIDDFLWAFVLEDQGHAVEFPEFGRMHSQDTTHKPFLSGDLAAKLQDQIKQVLARSTPPRATSDDMAMSSGLKRVLGNAAELAKSLEHKVIQPLHILAAAVGGDAVSPGVEAVRDSGVTQDAVLRAIEEE